MKKKSLTALLCGLITISLTGVGFASWIIVQGDKEEVTGQVSVETVVPKSITLTPSWKDNNGNETENEKSTVSSNNVTTYGDDCFSFGPKVTDTTYSWLKASSDSRGELLSLELDITISNAQLVNKNTGINFDIEVIDNSANGYDSAVEAGYINEVTAFVKGTTTKKFVPEATGEVEKTETFTIVISTTWGEYFDKDADGETLDASDNLNPFQYYNSYASTGIKTGTTTYANDASTTLGNLYTYLSGVSFKLTVQAEG